MNPWLPEKKVMKGFLRIFDPEMSFWLVQNPGLFLSFQLVWNLSSEGLRTSRNDPTSGNDSRISQRLMTVCLDD